MRSYKLIPIEQIIEPADPIRFEMADDALASLTESIKAQGILEPLCVRPAHVWSNGLHRDADGQVVEVGDVIVYRYEVMAGHRRLLCARRAGLPEVPCIVFEGEEDNALAVMIAENIEREEVTPFEEGVLYCKIADLPGITEARLQAVIKKPLGYIYARIDLLKGDPEIAKAVQRKAITLSVARELNKVKHDGYRAMYLERAVQGGCTTDLAKGWVSQWRMSNAGQTPAQQQPMEPLPGPEHIAQNQACWLCGGDEDPHNLEPVWIHREELRQLRMAREQYLQREAAGGAR
jgi:ParB family transcriptional regulator, chromosome partitioning protein